MKEKIQKQINQVRKPANSSAKEQVIKTTNAAQTNDSLSKSVRNSEKPNIFLAGLQAAIQVANGRK